MILSRNKFCVYAFSSIACMITLGFSKLRNGWVREGTSGADNGEGWEDVRGRYKGSRYYGTGELAHRAEGV